MTRRGRHGDQAFVQLRMSRSLLGRVERWRQQQETPGSRSDTIRVLIETALGPEGYGEDSLTKSFTRGQNNRLASFEIKPALVGKLIAIDGLFGSAIAQWRGIVAADFSPLLGQRAHAAFRGAAEMAMAGQVAESFPLTRAVLEYAAYAFYLTINPELVTVWFNRHASEESKADVRRRFSQSRISTAIAARDSELASVFGTLYERAIDFGAHPNERSITGNAFLEETDGRRRITSLYQHGDGRLLDHAIRTVAQAGVCALKILVLAHPDRLRPALEDQLAAVQAGL